MRILFIIPSIEGGGAENQMRLLSNQLAEEGNEVWVVYLHENDNVERILNPNVNRICLRITNNYSFKIILELYRIIKKVSPDIVQTWITQVDIIVGLLSMIAKFNWIVREPGDKLSRKQTYKLRLRKSLCSWKAKAIVANSRNGLRYWNDTNLNLSVIRNGYELEAFNNAGFLKKSRDFECEMIYVGRLEKSKNVLLLIKLLNGLPEDIRKGLRLTIVGQGSLKDQIEGENVSFHMRLLGYVNDKNTLIDLYKNSDVYCSLSASEGMPNTLIEAGLSGLSILASAIVPHKELLEEDYPFLLDLQDQQQMLAVIEKFFRLDEATKEVYTRQIRQNFLKYSIEEISTQYSSLYKNIYSSK